MEIRSTIYTVADYCQAMQRREIIVNRNYQRSEKVWPPAARSFLIESILLGYPIPKLSLYPVTDVKSRKTYKEIIDGQQRSTTILQFFQDELTLTKITGLAELSGLRYSQIDESLQHKFLDYALSVDLFVAATNEEIREAFRRINSYTVPLNPEEQRHAEFQGAFKWFIYELSRRHDENFLNLGVFNQKQLVRMADAKLFTEMAHAFINGITTTDAKRLRALYVANEKDFPLAAELHARFDAVINFLLDLPELHRGPLMKSYMFYSLGLAVSHKLASVGPLAKLTENLDTSLGERDVILANLSNLAAAADASDEDLPEGSRRYIKFVEASRTKTNVDYQRQTRFAWFFKALGRGLV